MPCYLLHMVEQPDPRPYDDPDLKDLVGSYPRFFCTQCNPPQPLKPGESVKCLNREEPCWMPAGKPCQ
jgi:hypothetical protein